MSYAWRGRLGVRWMSAKSTLILNPIMQTIVVLKWKVRTKIESMLENVKECCNIYSGFYNYQISEISVCNWKWLCVRICFRIYRFFLNNFIKTLCSRLHSKRSKKRLILLHILYCPINNGSLHSRVDRFF